MPRMAATIPRSTSATVFVELMNPMAINAAPPRRRMIPNSFFMDGRCDLLRGNTG
jgi:hypothetical protein